MTKKWAYAIEDRDWAQLTPVKNLPFEWEGPTAEFDIDPRSVSDCWWEIVNTDNGHHIFVYREKWEDVVDTETAVSDDCFLFLENDDDAELYWLDNGTLPKDRRVLYQDWEYYELA